LFESKKRIYAISGRILRKKNRPAFAGRLG